MRHLDNEMAVYLAERLETHLVDETGAQVLEAIQQMNTAKLPCSVMTLYTWLAGDGLDMAHETLLESAGYTLLMPLLSELIRINALTTHMC